MESAIFPPCSGKKILTALGFHDLCDGTRPHPIASVPLGEPGRAPAPFGEIDVDMTTHGI